MSRILALSFLIVLVGCKTQEQRFATIKLTASAGTYATLKAMRASRPDAENVMKIAISVKTATSGGVLDWQVIQQTVFQQIQELFDPVDQPIMMALASEITAAIQLALPANAPPSTVLIYINAGATGVVDGATFYIASITPSG